MAGIIKANSPSVSRVISGAVFNFDDISDKAQGVLNRIREEAAEAVLKAKQESDQIRRAAEEMRRAAEEQGKKIGESTAEKTIQDRVQAEVNERMKVEAERMKKEIAALAAPIQNVVTAIQQMRDEWLAEWERNVISLATQIAARVIRREVAQHPEISIDLLREALELASGCKQIQIHMHPNDCERYGDHVLQLVAKLNKQAKAELIPDATITSGGCRITSEFGEIDQQLETRLARIEEELS